MRTREFIDIRIIDIKNNSAILFSRKQNRALYDNDWA